MWMVWPLLKKMGPVAFYESEMPPPRRRDEEGGGVKCLEEKGGLANSARHRYKV